MLISYCAANTKFDLLDFLMRGSNNKHRNAQQTEKRSNRAANPETAMG